MFGEAAAPLQADHANLRSVFADAVECGDRESAVAIALGIVGVVAKGLLYLLIIGIAVFLVALILAALRMRRRPGRRPAR